MLCYVFFYEKLISTKLNKHLGGIGLLYRLLKVEWLLRAISMAIPEYVHLWMATQEQRDLKFLHLKIASSAATWYYGSALTK